jgi:hypothetical protein
VRGAIDALARDDRLARLMREEAQLLARASNVLAEARRFREAEMAKFWPAVGRRWAMALGLAVTVAFAAGAGYLRAYQPYAAVIADLQDRARLGDRVATRLLGMTPDEKCRFDALMRSAR